MIKISEIPTLMTATLRQVLEEVEALAKSQMWAMQRSDLPGNCIFDPLTPTVIRYRTELTEQSCIHELLHAKLWHSGFAFLRLRNPSDPNESLRHIASMLNGLFHHAVIFPQLSNLGFQAKESEGQGITNFLRKLKSTSRSADSLFDPLTAVVYARARLDTSFTDVDREFDSDELRPGMVLGHQLVKIVREYAIDDRHAFRLGLQKAMELLHLQTQLQLGSANAT